MLIEKIKFDNQKLIVEFASEVPDSSLNDKIKYESKRKVHDEFIKYWALLSTILYDKIPIQHQESKPQLFASEISFKHNDKDKKLYTSFTYSYYGDTAELEYVIKTPKLIFKEEVTRKDNEGNPARENPNFEKQYLSYSQAELIENLLKETKNYLNKKTSQMQMFGEGEEESGAIPEAFREAS